MRSSRWGLGLVMSSCIHPLVGRSMIIRRMSMIVLGLVSRRCSRVWEGKERERNRR